jgi:sugar phosphate permease
VGLFRIAHYRWVVAAAGVPVLMSAIGLGRFAFAMQLPGMQAGMHLSSAQMGLIGTGNFGGYLIAMFLSPFMVRRYRPRLNVVTGLLVVGGSLLMMSQCHVFLSLTICFTITGVGTGLANIAMMALLTWWFSNDERGKATGVALCGNGVGIVLAGALIPHFNRVYGIDGWRAGWITLGLIGFAVAAISGMLLRNDPRELGLQPVGRVPVAVEGVHGAREMSGNHGVLARLGFLYMVVGVTSAIYGAFIVFSMIHEYGLSETTAGFYWSWMGICSLFSGVGFGALSDRIGRRYSLAVVFGVYTAAFALAGFKLGPGAVFVSVLLFGLSIFGSVAIVITAMGDYFEASKVAHALSFAFMISAVGQTVGPIAAGLIAGSKGVFTRAYLISALISVAAALFALTLPAVARREKTKDNDMLAEGT